MRGARAGGERGAGGAGGADAAAAAAPAGTRRKADDDAGDGGAAPGDAGPRAGAAASPALLQLFTPEAHSRKRRRAAATTTATTQTGPREEAVATPQGLVTPYGARAGAYAAAMTDPRYMASPMQMHMSQPHQQQFIALRQQTAMSPASFPVFGTPDPQNGNEAVLLSPHGPMLAFGPLTSPIPHESPFPHFQPSPHPQAQQQQHHQHPQQHNQQHQLEQQHQQQEQQRMGPSGARPSRRTRRYNNETHAPQGGHRRQRKSRSKLLAVHRMPYKFKSLPQALGGSEASEKDIANLQRTIDEVFHEDIVDKDLYGRAFVAAIPAPGKDPTDPTPGASSLPQPQPLAARKPSREHASSHDEAAEARAQRDMYYGQGQASMSLEDDVDQERLDAAATTAALVYGDRISRVGGNYETVTLELERQHFDFIYDRQRFDQVFDQAVRTSELVVDSAGCAYKVPSETLRKRFFARKWSDGREELGAVYNIIVVRAHNALLQSDRPDASGEPMSEEKPMMLMCVDDILLLGIEFFKFMSFAECFSLRTFMSALQSWQNSFRLGDLTLLYEVPAATSSSGSAATSSSRLSHRPNKPRWAMRVDRDATSAWRATEQDDQPGPALPAELMQMHFFRTSKRTFGRVPAIPIFFRHLYYTIARIGAIRGFAPSTSSRQQESKQRAKVARKTSASV